MRKEIFLIGSVSIFLTGCIGDQETAMFISPKVSAVVHGSDVLIDYNGDLIVASGEAQTYKQLLQQNGANFEVVKVQSITGGISYKLDPIN